MAKNKTKKFAETYTGQIKIISELQKYHNYLKDKNSPKTRQINKVVKIAIKNFQRGLSNLLLEYNSKGHVKKLPYATWREGVTIETYLKHHLPKKDPEEIMTDLEVNIRIRVFNINNATRDAVIEAMNFENKTEPNAVDYAKLVSLLSIDKRPLLLTEMGSDLLSDPREYIKRYKAHFQIEG